MDNSITTTIHVFDCANFNKMQIKCIFTPKQRVTRNKNAFQKKDQKRVSTKVSKYSGIMTIHVDITDIILTAFPFLAVKKLSVPTVSRFGENQGYT